MTVGVGGGLYPVAAPAAGSRVAWTSGSGYINNFGDYRGRNLGNNSNFNFSFMVPADFASLISLEAICINVAATPTAAADIDLFSDYGLLGQQSNFNSESDITSVYTVPAVGELFAIDLSSVFTSLAVNHFCGVNIDHNGVGGNIFYLGIRTIYLPL